MLPWLAKSVEQSGALDEARDANLWYCMERNLADSAAQAVESWRVTRDLWAELLFERLYAA